MRQFSLYLIILSILSIGCSTINETSKEQMNTGIYKVRNQNNKHYYAVVEEDSITLHPVNKTNEGWIADTSLAATIQLNAISAGSCQPLTFVSRKPVLNILSIVFKYRPSTDGFPNQLHTNFNAAGYIGYGSESYILAYDKNPLNSYERKMHHFGYSFGLFGGLGAPEITPSVTNDNVQIEYYGVIFTKGVTGMVSVGSLTFGAAIGFDHLLDKNRKFWIYQGKPWIGLAVGLSLN